MRTKRQKLIAAGKCVNYSRCGNERGDDGTATMCRLCADGKAAKQAPIDRRKRAKHRRRRLCLDCPAPVYRGRKRCKDHLRLNALGQMEQRRKQSGVN